MVWELKLLRKFATVLVKAIDNMSGIGGKALDGAFC